MIIEYFFTKYSMDRSKEIIEVVEDSLEQVKDSIELVEDSISFVKH